MSQNQVILVISDLHGNNIALSNAIAKGYELAARAEKKVSHIVTLGDYCDNGPHVSELIDSLINMKAVTPKIHTIMGNHDLMALYNMDLGKYFGVRYEEKFNKHNIKLLREFNDEWKHYFNSETNFHFTPLQYGMDVTSLPNNVPYEHKKFLVELNLYYKIGNYVFVHSGLDPAIDADKQLAFLDKKNFAHIGFPHIPSQLRSKQFSRVSHPGKYIVVSGHNKFYDKKNFVAPKRLVFHSGSCQGDNVHCALLPEHATSLDQNECIFYDVPLETENLLKTAIKIQCKIEQQKKRSKDMHSHNKKNYQNQNPANLPIQRNTRCPKHGKVRGLVNYYNNYVS